MKFKIKVAGILAGNVEVGEIEIEQEYSAEEMRASVACIKDVIQLIKTEIKPLVQVFKETQNEMAPKEMESTKE